MAKTPDIAIIGGGYSGSLLTTHLLQSGKPVNIFLIEKAQTMLGKGVAYSTTDETHLLNVAAGRMSAFADEPLHFLNWLHKQGYSFGATDFVPRKIYGDYISSILRQALKQASASQSVKHIAAEAIALKRGAEGKQLISLSTGETLLADKTVLAIGNFPPADIKTDDNNYLQSPHYFGNPWDTNIFNNLQPQAPVLIIGTGLTMVDMVMSLNRLQHRGQVLALSTHGYTPQAHAIFEPYTGLDPAELLACTHIDMLVKKIHRHIVQAARQGTNWRAVIDAIRPHTQALWQNFSVHEKEEFMDKVRHMWGVARHRIPQAAAEVLHQKINSGQLHICAARVKSITEQNNQLLVTYRDRGSDTLHSFAAERVINCTGPESDYQILNNPLTLQMLRDGLAACDSMHLGLNVTPDGCLLNKENKLIENIFTLGPTMKGVLWESVAVPELRHQAQDMAKKLLQ